MSKSLVEVDRLVVRRGGRIVIDDLSFEVRAGEVTGLLGPSGCGKSTLLRALVGVQRTDSGQVRVDGLPAGSGALRARVGYVTQSPSVYGDLTVRENLRFFGQVLGVRGRRVEEVMVLVRLDGLGDRIVDRLSGGQRARVSLGVALLGDPVLAVLDEPTVGLDPVLRAELWQRFDELARAGTAVLVSSHVMDEARRCDRLLLMREGTLIADETPEQLLSRTGATDVEGAFLSLVARSGASSHRAEEVS